MRLTIEEAAPILRSDYGMEYKDRSITPTIVSSWIEQGFIKAYRNGSNQDIVIDRLDLEDFVEDSYWEGTAFEKGIDDQTKIERLIDEVRELKIENARLRKENSEYALKLGIEDF